MADSGCCEVVEGVGCEPDFVGEIFEYFVHVRVGAYLRSGGGVGVRLVRGVDLVVVFVVGNEPSCVFVHRL